MLKLRNSLSIAAMVALAATLSAPASALEVHTFFNGQCGMGSGVVLHVDETLIGILSLDGRYGEIPRDAVNQIVVHKTLQTPLPRITVDDKVRALARGVWLSDSDAPTVVGWAVGFFDDLVIFHDTDGQTHVIELDDIQKIGPVPASLPATLRLSAYAPTTLDYPPELVPCSTGTTRGDVRPTRVIGDRIKISDYMAGLEKKFLDLSGFEERTRVYARPFLFDRTMRVGFGFFSRRSEGANYLPFYFQWTNGGPYRLQQVTAIGKILGSWIPTLEPTISAKSDLKVHFFHASLMFHMFSPAAGMSAFDVGQYFQSPLRDKGELSVDSLFNYVMIMGGDYGPWSLGGGPFYRSTRLVLPLPSQAFEILAESASPTVRLMWTGPQLRGRIQYFRTRQNGPEGRHQLGYSHDLSAESFSPPGAAMPNSPSGAAMPNYALRIDSVRIGADYEAASSVRVSVDGLITVGQYTQNPSTDLRYTHLHAGLSLGKSFGRYVALLGYVNAYHETYALSFALPDTYVKVHGGGALEFLF